MPSATPTTSSTTRRSRCPTDTLSAMTAAIGAKNGRAWCSQSKAISQDSPAATPAWAAKSSATRTRRTRSASVARERWPSSLSVSTVVRTRSRAVAMVIKASQVTDRDLLGREVGERCRPLVGLSAPAQAQQDQDQDHHAAEDQRPAERQYPPGERRA